MGSRVVWSISIVWAWFGLVAGEGISVVDDISFLTPPSRVTVFDSSEESDNKRVSGKEGMSLGSFDRPASMPLFWSR